MHFNTQTLKSPPALLFLFFLLLLSLLVTVSGWRGKMFLYIFRQLWFWTCVTNIGNPSSNTLTNYCVYVLKFRLFELSMPCALKMNHNGQFKVEFCPSTTKNIISSLPQCLWQTTWQGGDLPLGPPIRDIVWLFDHIVLRDHLTNWNYYISITKVDMATKLCRTVTYLDVLLSIKSHDLLNRCSCEIMWQTKTITSSRPQYLGPPKLLG